MKNILFVCIVLVFTLQCSKDDPAPTPNPCESVQCLHGGTCDDGTCNCGPWYEGTDCGQEVRAKFFGDYTGTLINKNGTTTTSSLVTVNFASSSSGAEYLRVDNNWNIKLVDAAGVFSIPGGQTISGIAVSRGYGTFSGNQAILTFGGGSQDITFYGTR